MFFKGIMPAIVTPLMPDESVNVPVLEKLIGFFLEKGADGFYVAGATGEGLALRKDQRMLLAEAAVSSAGDKPCIVQVASTDFSQAIALAKHAQAVGAKAISATPPLFFRYDEQDVYNYYKALAEAVDIPLIVYNSPLAGFPMTPDFIARLFGIDNVTGVKWTSSDYYGVMKLKQLTGGEINILNGPDEMLLMGLTAGADGGIGATYNFMFPLFRKIYDCYHSGDLAGAQQYQNQVTKMITALRAFNTIPAAKAMLRYKGFEVGDAAFPLKHLDEKAQARVIETMEGAGWNCEIFGA